MTHIPKDPVILLSYMNTQLRDFYPSLKDCCQSLGILETDIIHTLKAIDYHYNKEKNQFI